MNAVHAGQFSATLAGASGVYIDAGVGHLRLLACTATDRPLLDTTLTSGGDLRNVLASWRLAERFGRGNAAPVYVTGKLAPLVRDAMGCGTTIPPASAAWLTARSLICAEPDETVGSLAIVDLSASGYLLVGVDRSGALRDDLLVVNPRCGAGSGINLDRVLQKLALARGDVDMILAGYAGAEGRDRRLKTATRADRCGVFSSSATISDKNQGIPLDVALATTLKSEVLKACRKLPAGFDKVCLTGRVFHWRFARECAEDWLREQGVRQICWDPDNTQMLAALRAFARRAGPGGIAQPDPRLSRDARQDAYPAMSELKRRYEAQQRYLRQPDLAPTQHPGARRLHIALDVGSTMAKAALADADSGEVCWLQAYSNAGDTIETIKRIFQDLVATGCERPQVAGIGVTGSARYQVQQALEHIFPELAGRVSVLVENYAHAHGSIALAREHVQRLKRAGVEDVNEHFCILVDIGGEDTKVSTIALAEAELFGNAMNLKCSAGTGSLMDTLATMFGLTDVGAACAEAYKAPQAFAINATCAVFLMENARKLQLQGVPRDQILASANWAIVENMARTLWKQLELPPNTVVLLHGQTMLSEPLPVAVTHRLHAHIGSPVYALVPPNPGHRACLGLINTLRQTVPEGSACVELERFLQARFDKRIVQCRGAVCEDKAARCNRSSLTCRDAAGHKLVSFTVGGCSAINELLARSKKDLNHAPDAPARDAYKEIWDFVASRHPRSDRADRLVIPRSFAVSEWAFLFARLFERLGIPVSVDAVRESDLALAQPLFHVDTCAPHIGAVGQYQRLAGEPHGLILAPQLEFLPANGRSAGRTCTLNQGGVAVAMNLARLAQPDARFHLFSIDLSRLEPEALRVQLQDRLQPVFARYGAAPDAAALRAALAGAIDDHQRLRAQSADLAADMAEEALAQGKQIAVVVGREYILNPGIFDSHVRRLLRDKNRIVLPSYVLDVELNPEYRHIYWRNPHFIVSLLDAVSRRQLHERLRHARLREVFRRIEQQPALLAVVQVSTFSCGPDSVVQPFVTEIMRQRPFLLIQSDAVLKELAHLENRVNTYVKQLELGLHERLHDASAGPFEIRTLDELRCTRPIDRATDVIVFPTMADNRPLTATLRGAGYTCIDNYDDRDYDLSQRVRAGRRAAGDAVCAPLAGIYADMESAVDEFVRRRNAGDPEMAGKRRLLFFDNKGPGPCRQGQYFDMHRILHYQKTARQRAAAAPGDAACGAAAGNGVLQFLVAHEVEGFDIGVGEWVLARAHQGAILQGVLHQLFFTVGAACRDYQEFERFVAEFRALKEEVYRAQENFHGPGPAAQAWLKRFGHRAWLGAPVKYLAYGLAGRDLVGPIRRFASRWVDGRAAHGSGFRVVVTGEVYMRVSQAEEIFRLLAANLGFGRFELEYTPLWSYLESALEEGVDAELNRMRGLRAGAADAARARGLRASRARRNATRALQQVLRHLVARPLYRAAHLPMPAAAGDAMAATRELLPTLRPESEITTYLGEAIEELKRGAGLVLNVGPTGCMVSTMGEVLTPAIAHAAGAGAGRVQHLFSADGDVNEELLTVALLKAMGLDRYHGVAPAPAAGTRGDPSPGPEVDRGLAQPA
ncbi:MAG TPA: BadF/BadG/BcrA/BcrD ATPase family protein [Burkholderiales bacterium]|nr:BadF/BadG/BcrA/BcrD ATPase family protein [Burkholderiales bacterium]